MGFEEEEWKLVAGNRSKRREPRKIEFFWVGEEARKEKRRKTGSVQRDGEGFVKQGESFRPSKKQERRCRKIWQTAAEKGETFFQFHLAIAEAYRAAIQALFCNPKE